MIRKAILLISVITLFLLGSSNTMSAQNSSANTSNVQVTTPKESLKDIQYVYLGFVQGNPVRTRCFCEQLKYYLAKYGFTIVPDQKYADATLTGNFHAFANLNSHAKVILNNQENKQLWEYYTETPWFGNSRLKLGAYFSNSNQYACGGASEKWRAIYVAQALKKAKMKANKT